MANKRNNNPRNPENDLFKKLTRLLSGPITGYRRQSPVKPRRRDLGKYNILLEEGCQVWEYVYLKAQKDRNELENIYQKKIIKKLEKKITEKNVINIIIMYYKF